MTNKVETSQPVLLKRTASRASGPDQPAQVFPYDGSCDVASIQANSEWQPSPIVEFVLKIESRCNLNCDYCYVYNMGDASWRDQPTAMGLDVVDALAARIDAHASRHMIPRVLLSLHGGEPLLRGVGHAEAIVTRFRERLPDLDLKFSMQTNALNVTEDIAARLAVMEVGVGVSVDGPGSANGHRLDVQGRQSIERVLSGIQILSATPGLLSGVLCVIDLENDPAGVFDFLATLGSPSIDFLLPHGNWVNRPVGKEAVRIGRRDDPAPYADWLIAVFDRWFYSPHRGMKVRLFNDLIHLLLGGEATYEAVGLSPAQLVVIESDGAIELVDHIGPTFNGAEYTGASVFDTELDELLRHPGVVCRQIGAQALARTCRTCKNENVCGGGLITHRWNDETGFRNPTVFCSDMDLLIHHIERSVGEHLHELT